MSNEESVKKFEQEFEDKDLQSLKILAISEGADADEVNACQEKSCIVKIIISLRLKKFETPENENVSMASSSDKKLR